MNTFWPSILKPFFNWSRTFSGTRMSQNVPTSFPIRFFSNSEKDIQGLPVLAIALFIQWNSKILQKKDSEQDA
jgi:hypothetical protein